MADQIHIRMFGRFNIFVNGRGCGWLAAKSKKGVALLQALIVRHPAPAPNLALIAMLWPEGQSGNPENALKTLISRLRALLNQCSPGLGNCIAAARGCYRFLLCEGLSLDLFDFEQISRKLEGCASLTEETDGLYREALALYTGSLLEGSSQDDWIASRCIHLHGQYLHMVYTYLALLKVLGRYDEILQTCRFALENNPFDQRLHLELMGALVKINRTSEALMQYNHVAHMHSRYLGESPPEGIQEFYQQIVRSGDTLDRCVDALCLELRKFGEDPSPFECEYTVFREVFRLQMSGLERLEAGMCIGLVMITGMDGEPLEPLELDSLMRELGAVLRAQLRKGDTLTHFGPSQYALLLPTVSCEGGRAAMEHIKRHFYQRFPGNNVKLSYRLRPLHASRPGAGARPTQDPSSF